MSGLEKATHICLIAVSVVSLTLLIERRFGGGNSPPSSGGSMVGRSLALGSVNWSRSPKNVVIGVKSTCKYCAASLPFFRRISGARGGRGTGISVIAISSEEPEITRGFLGKADVAVDQVLQVPLERLGIRGTPTVLLVDARGVVQKEFAGALSHEGEEALLTALSGQAVGFSPATR